MSQLFDKHLAQTSPFPLGVTITRAEGIYLYDSDGKRYADLISGVGVSALGHGNAAVNAAIKAQVDQHLHVMVYGEFVQEAQVNAAQSLVALLPDALDTVYFVNSGAEATEAAIKLARRSTGRSAIKSFQGAYHGSTTGALALASNPLKKDAFRPLMPGVDILPWNKTAALQSIDTHTAAVFLETIQGDAGVRIPDPKWMTALRARCTEVGALLVLDEIQCGMGRTGSWFAFEHFGIVPDVLLLGKGLGAGMPIGALVANRGLLERFTHDPMLGHITTFGGHPVACAAAHAGISEMQRLKVMAGVEEKGALIASLLSDHPAIRAFRRIGLMLAVELESDEHVQHVVEGCLAKGVVVFWFLSLPNAFRMAPPLVITEEEIREVCGVLCEVLDDLS